MELLSTNSLTILAGTGLFFVLAMLLVIVLLVAKKYLVPSGNVKITINDKDTVSTTSGNITGPGLLAEDYDFGTVSGDISLTALPADGSDIDCETVSGEARISCTAAPDEVSFNSVSGDLRLTLPEGSCRYTLDLSTVSGDRDTDGFLSSGDKLCAITAETVSGDVELRTGP